MATINTLNKQGKLDQPRQIRYIEIPKRVLKTTLIPDGKGGHYERIDKLAPIQFKGGRLKGSKELIAMRKQVQRLREGGIVVC